ncbi:TonB-dependent receptor [bacterium]|nr:TonB-dependent receptor [bacterium]
MNKKILLGFITVLSAANLYAQTGTVQGRVLDAETKQPLLGTNVLVEGTTLGAAADAMGFYTIGNVPVGTVRLRFTYIGYEPLVKTDIVIKTAVDAVVNAELIPQIVKGEGVTVTAGYFQTGIDVEPSVTALSREEIRRFPGGFEDVVRTVSTLPGVAINMSGGRNDLLVRGGGPSENLYLINNIEVPNINHFGTPGNTGGSLSFVNLDFVDDVTFSTGGFGARYGDKMSSVISLSLLKKRPDRFQAKGTVSATQYGFDFELPLSDRGGMTFSARKSYLDLIFKAAGLPFVPVYTDFNVLANYELSPKDRFLLVGLSAIDNVDRNQSTLENRVFNAGLLDNSQYKGITGLNYRRLFEKGYMDITLSVNLSRFRLSQIDENQTEYFRNHADEWETAVKWQVTRSLGSGLTFTGGLAAKEIRNNSTTVFADSIYNRSGMKISVDALGVDPETRLRASGRKSAAYLELEWKPFPALSVHPGIRADYFDFINDPLTLSPRLAVQMRVNPLISLRASGGLYTQAPSYVWVVNPFNQDLKAMTNRMLVVGGDYLVRNDTRLSVEAYIKRYSDLPAGTVPGVTDYIVITNTGTSFGGREDDFQSFGFYNLVSDASGSAYGSEVSLQKKFSDIPLYGLVSLAYNRSEFTAVNGKTYPGQYDQHWILNVSGGYIFNDRWEISAKFRAFSGVPYTPVYRPAENPVNPGSIENLPVEYLTARLDPGHHLDIRVDRTFNFPALTMIVYVDIQNVYNYKIPMKPAYDFWNDRIETSSSIGILPSVGISLEI